MAPVALLDPQPGERICDLCAAPGGKSTQIAGRMGGEGLLLCNEFNPGRSKILSRNIERMGIANALVTNEHPQRLAQRLPEYFDRVLIDAPCSGEGMFRKEEAAITDWSPETVAMCARRQAEILESGAFLVRPGGRLVYSTCTFAQEENEDTIRAFLSTHPDFALEAVDAPWFETVEPGMYRMWPHKLLGEGHFAAVLRRSGESENEKVAQPQEKLPSQWLAFAKDLGIELPAGKPCMFGENLYWLPLEMPELKGLKVLRAGLELGCVKKDRFEPAHALALWLSDARRCVSLDLNATEHYLKGNVFPSSERGWCLIKTGAFSIGWGKGDGTQMKNHYPKGLRRLG